jgi:hypothetical protein
MDVYNILASNIQFLSKHTFNKELGVIKPGAKRRIASSTYYYPYNTRDMMTWSMQYIEEGRIYNRKTIDCLNTSGANSLPNSDRFISMTEGVIKIDSSGTYSFQVTGDDGVVFMCNGQMVGRYYGAGSTVGNITFEAAGLYDFTLLHQEYTGGQAYAVVIKGPNDNGYRDICDGMLFHREGYSPGLKGIRGPTSTYTDWDDILSYMHSHKYADIITPFINLDRYAYRFFDRGNYWGYSFEGVFRFPESGEWELGTYADNYMQVVFDGEDIPETRPPTWDRVIRPVQKTIKVTAGIVYPVRISMREITGGEIFIFAVRKKGETAWRTDLTGIAFHKDS